MTNIWHNNEEPGFEKGKAHTSFSKWRVLIMERLMELGKSQDDAVVLIQEKGLTQLGLDYDNGLTAEQVARNLAK